MSGGGSAKCRAGSGVVVLARQLVEFGRTIRFSHSLFALPFALGTALLAEPPCPDGWSMALLVACMVAARTAAMGMNRVADVLLDARNPRTVGWSIPAGRLSRRTALALTILSGAAFIGLAWLFAVLRENVWPGILAPAFLVVLFGYSWTKRVTVLTHWFLGLCLGLSPVGVWIALRAELDLLPILIGAGVLFWTAGFDILYAFQDVEVDRRDGLHSVPARLGLRAARWVSRGSHLATVIFLAGAVLCGSGYGRTAVVGEASGFALDVIALMLLIQHIRLRRADAERLAAAFFPMNVAVSMIWLAGVVVDMVAGPGVRLLP